MTRIALAAVLLMGLFPLACSTAVTDMQPATPMQMTQPLVGQWLAGQGHITLRIFSDNRFELAWQEADGTKSLRRGALVATDRQLRVLFDPDAPDCVDQLGIYAWQRMDNTLALGVVRDGCDQRAGKLTHAFTLDASVSAAEMQRDADPTEPQPDTHIEHSTVNMSPDTPIGEPQAD